MTPGGQRPVNPARAGMIRQRPPPPTTHPRKPRASGDDPLDLNVFHGDEK